MTRVTGLRSYFDVRMGSMLVVHDRVGMAHMRRPSTPYLSLGIRLSRPIDPRSPLVSPRRRSHCWALPSPAWEGGGPPTRGGALFLVLDRVVVVGHT